MPDPSKAARHFFPPFVVVKTVSPTIEQSEVLPQDTPDR
jgi:hypothetical protein